MAAADQAGVVRQRHLRDVELLILQHAPEDFRRLQCDVIELDALGRDGAVAQRLGAVIGSASQGEPQIGHDVPPSVPIPKFASSRYQLLANFGIVGTLATY